ncbi:MAG: hypothetical protein IKI84_11340 [Clostridia bacterium]|nr:hypothetical protein [Clostridia bacterium]
MKITFKTTDLAKIMLRCGSITSGVDKVQLVKHPFLGYVRMDYDGRGVNAVGMDAYKMMTVTVPCEAGVEPFSILVKPFKVPARKFSLATITDLDDNEHVLVEFSNPGSNKSEVISVGRGAEDLGYPDKWNVLLPIDRVSTYQIRLGPRNLAGLLKAFKDDEHLDFDFGSCVQPVLVHGEDPDVIGMILPMRP